MILTVGEDYNALQAAGRNNPTCLTLTPGHDSKFPARNLWDGLPEKYTRWQKGSGDGAARRGKADLNQVKNPGAEQGMAGWKKVGTVVSSSAQAATGTKSFLVNDGAEFFQEIKVRSGDYYETAPSIRGGTGTGATYIQDRKTGRWLQPDGTWGGELAFYSRSTTSFLAQKTPFRAETYAETGLHRTTLRLFGRASGGNAYIDDFVVYPAINFSSAHGVGFPRRFAPGIYSSDTGAFGGEETLRMSMDPHQPAFYSYLTSLVRARYWQWRFTIDADVEGIEQPTLGEWVLAQAMSLTLPTLNRAFSSRYGSGVKFGWAQAAKPPKTLALELAQPSRAVRALSLPFRAYDTIWDETLYQWFVLRCRAAREKVVIAVPELQEGLVVHGSFDGARGYALNNPSVQDLESIQIIEDAFPKPVKGESI